MNRKIFKPSTDFSPWLYNPLRLRTRGNLQQPVYSQWLFSPHFLTVFEVCKSLQHSAVSPGFLQKEHVSEANIPSEQIVCTSGPSAAHVSLRFTSFHLKRLLSFPHAPNAIYQKHPAQIWKSSMLHSQSHYFFTYWRRQNKTCAATSSKTCSSKIRGSSRESSLKFHFTSSKWVVNKLYYIFFPQVKLQAFLPQTRPAPIFTAP